jgi:hypothetical protein
MQMVDRVENKPKVTETFLEGRDRAIERLDGILDLRDYSGDIVKYILETYDYKDGDISGLSHQWRLKTAMELLTNDLLLSNFYNPDGTFSEYVKPWIKIAGEQIDPTEYVYIGVTANEFASQFSSLSYMYGEPSRAIIIDKYVRKFREATKKEKDIKYVEDLPILVIPGEIYINQERGEKGVHLVYSNHFEAPYGGENGQDITIFRHRFHKIPTTRK